MKIIIDNEQRDIDIFSLIKCYVIGKLIIFGVLLFFMVVIGGIATIFESI